MMRESRTPIQTVESNQLSARIAKNSSVDGNFTFDNPVDRSLDALLAAVPTNPRRRYSP
jgi:hypothetical protein